MQQTSFRQKITLIVLGIGLFLLLLEVGLRAGGYILTTIREQSNKKTLSRVSKYRILCLGESTTAGEYPPYLQEILDQRYKGGTVAVIDKGTPGVNSSVIVSHLEDNLSTYKPDIVVVMMGIGDGWHRSPVDRSAVAYSPFWRFIQGLRLYKLGILLWQHIVHFIHTFHPVSQSRESEQSFIEERLLRALDADSRNVDAYIKLGRLYRESGRYKKAENMYRKSLAIDPENAAAYANCGLALLRQDRIDEAETMFKKALSIDAYDDWPYFHYGILLRITHRYEEALACFKQGLEMNKRNIDCFRFYEEMALCYKAIGNDIMAWKYFEQAVQQRETMFNLMTLQNYNRLKEIVIGKDIVLICSQYPMRSVKNLKAMLAPHEGVFFVDNETTFKEAVMKSDYDDYFRDNFAYDFGHCTDKGNRLLAENIAHVILKEVLNTIER